jgi:hypothetical protein
VFASLLWQVSPSLCHCPENRFQFARVKNERAAPIPAGRIMGTRQPLRRIRRVFDGNRRQERLIGSERRFLVLLPQAFVGNARPQRFQVPVLRPDLATLFLLAGS